MTTKEQVYLENGGSKCPHCDSPNIVATESVQIDGGVGTQAIECADCGKSWTDILRLVSVDLGEQDNEKQEE